MLGLFGAIVVDESNGHVQSYVDGDGAIVSTKRSQLSKEFVLFMVGSTFWGTEISRNGNQQPLWANPDLSAYQDDLLRFHVLAVGPGHTFICMHTAGSNPAVHRKLPISSIPISWMT